MYHPQGIKRDQYLRWERYALRLKRQQPHKRDVQQLSADTGVRPWLCLVCPFDLALAASASTETPSRAIVVTILMRNVAVGSPSGWWHSHQRCPGAAGVAHKYIPALFLSVPWVPSVLSYSPGAASFSLLIVCVCPLELIYFTSQTGM